MKLTAIIEMPEGTTDKIEVKNGSPIVDRVISIPVPANYGFIPNTMAADGDPKDIFVVSQVPLKTMDQVEVKVIGEFLCTDQGVEDNKLFALKANEEFDKLTVLKNMTQIGDYLLNYKPGFKILGYKNIEE